MQRLMVKSINPKNFGGEVGRSSMASIKAKTKLASWP